MSFGSSFQGMVGMFAEGFGIQATLAKNRTSSYDPVSGVASLVGPEPVTIWGVWAGEPDTPLQEGETLAPTRSKSRDFVIPAKDLVFEPKIGDSLTVGSETFDIVFVRSVRDGETVISYRLALERS